MRDTTLWLISWILELVEKAGTRFGVGSWGVHLNRDHERICRSWSIAGHSAAAAYVLRGVWRQWLDLHGLSDEHCPVPNLFKKNSKIVAAGVVASE